jgi:hypothetical protein
MESSGDGAWPDLAAISPKGKEHPDRCCRLRLQIGAEFPHGISARLRASYLVAIRGHNTTGEEDFSAGNSIQVGPLLNSNPTVTLLRNRDDPDIFSAKAMSLCLHRPHCARIHTGDNPAPTLLEFADQHVPNAQHLGRREAGIRFLFILGEIFA